MSGHEPEKAGHCLCLLLIRLDNLLLQSGGNLPCTTLPRCRLRPRMRAGFVVVVAEGGLWGAGDLLRLLLRQYVQESFGAPGGHGWSGADRRKGPEENKCGSLAMAGSWGSS